MSPPKSAFDKLNLPLHIVTDDPRTQDTQGGAGVAIQHGVHILYAILDSDNYVTLLTNNVAEYQRTGRFESLNTWTKVAVKDQVPGSMRATIKSERALSIAALGDYVYVFWRSPDHQQRVLRTRPEQITQFELATVSLPNVGGGDIISNLAVFPLPAALPSLEGKLGVVALWQQVNTTYVAVRARVLDPETFTARSTWQAEDLSGMAAYFEYNNPKLPQYTNVTAGWIDHGRVQLAANETPRSVMSLIVNTHNTSGTSPSILSYGMDLLATFDSAYRNAAHASVNPVHLAGLESAGSLGATLYTTPDGKLWTKYTQNHLTTSAVLVTDTTAASDPVHGTPGLHGACWQQADDFVGHRIQAKAYNTPCTLFLQLAPTVGASPVTVPPPRDSAGKTGSSKIYDHCTLQTFVECVLASDERHVPQMSTFMWGQAFRIPNYIVSSLVPEQQSRVQLTLVADTFPVPVPVTDLWGPDSPSGMVNWLVASYEYLVGDETAVELEYSVSSAYGFKTSSLVTALGFGGIGESSLAEGFATLASEAHQTLRASSFSVTTKGTPPALATNPDEHRLNIAAEGAYFGMTPPVQIGVDAYLVLPRGASTISDVVEVGIHPVLSDGANVTLNGDYRTYCYTPGNLLTYDTGAIDNRMRQLFDALPSSDKQRFVIDGEDFGRLYTGGNYVAEIVKRFGKDCLGPNGGQPYLEFSFAETAIRRSEFQSTSSFTEGGTSFVDGSIYTGIGWDQMVTGGFGAVGMVEISTNLLGASGYVMVGTQFSSTVGATNTASNTWGVKLGEYLNPLAPGESYTARMYLLEPSRLWALEMALFGGAGPNIDVANSAPIRILFTVPYISDALRDRLRTLPT